MPQGPTLDPRLLAREPSNFLANAIQSGVGGFMQGRQLRLQEEQMDMAREEAARRAAIGDEQLKAARIQNTMAETEVAAQRADLANWRESKGLPSFEDLRAGQVPAVDGKPTPASTFASSFNPQSEAEYNGFLIAMRQSQLPPDTYANLGETDKLLVDNTIRSIRSDMEALGRIQDTTGSQYNEALRRINQQGGLLDDLLGRDFGTRFVSGFTDQSGRDLGLEVLRSATREAIASGVIQPNDRVIVARFANRLGVRIPTGRNDAEGKPITREVQPDDLKGNSRNRAIVLDDIGRRSQGLVETDDDDPPPQLGGNRNAPAGIDATRPTPPAVQARIEALNDTFSGLRSSGSGGRNQPIGLNGLDLL
jgi:hypothetical protein